MRSVGGLDCHLQRATQGIVLGSADGRDPEFEDLLVETVLRRSLEDLRSNSSAGYIPASAGHIRAVKFPCLLPAKCTDADGRNRWLLLLHVRDHRARSAHMYLGLLSHDLAPLVPLQRLAVSAEAMGAYPSSHAAQPQAPAQQRPTRSSGR